MGLGVLFEETGVQPSRGRWLGCLVFLAALGGWLYWEAKEPRRRAQALIASFRPGMSLADVLALPDGRWLCCGVIPSPGLPKPREVRIVAHPGGSRHVTWGLLRDTFQSQDDLGVAVLQKAGDIAPRASYSFVFAGIGPGEVFVTVTFGEDGAALTVQESE